LEAWVGTFLFFEFEEVVVHPLAQQPSSHRARRTPRRPRHRRGTSNPRPPEAGTVAPYPPYGDSTAIGNHRITTGLAVSRRSTDGRLRQRESTHVFCNDVSGPTGLGDPSSLETTLSLYGTENDHVTAPRNALGFVPPANEAFNAPDHEGAPRPLRPVTRDGRTGGRRPGGGRERTDGGSGPGRGSLVAGG